jgi:hypothetical protein
MDRFVTQLDFDDFERLMRENQRVVYQIAYSVLRNADDAEDVTQEAFLRVRRLALNRMRSEMRARRRQRPDRCASFLAAIDDEGRTRATGELLRRIAGGLCPLERIAMRYGRITIAAFAATVAYYIFGSVGGFLSASYYSAYAAIFRPRELIMNYMSLGFAGTFIAMFVIATIYARGYKGKGGAEEGLRFGVLIGLFVVFASVVHDFVILNIGRDLALVQALGELVGWTLSGIVIGLVYRPLPTSTRSDA